MNLAPAIKYNIRDSITKVILTYYGIFVLFVALLFFLSKIYSINMSGSIINISFNSILLLIMMGLIFTRPSFRFLTQIGVSRKTQAAAKIIGIIIISAVVAVADRVVDVAATYLYKSSSMTYEANEIFFNSFSYTLAQLHPFAREMTVIGLAFTTRVMIFAAAVFVAMLYVRMSSITKVVVTIGVPLIVIYGAQLLARFSEKPMGIRFFNNLDQITGLSDGQPNKTILCMASVAVIFFALLYLAMRRAPMND